MKLILERNALHLETDDGIHSVYSFADMPRVKAKCGLDEFVHAVNSMFRCVERYRTNTPVVGALMRRKGSKGPGRVVTSIKVRPRKLVGFGGKVASIPWGRLEYAT